MHWQKKHPRGGKPQYMGFDSFTSRPREKTVHCKLVNGSDVWIPFESCTISEACIRHPDAIRFARFGTYDEIRCDGPAAEGKA